MLSAQGIPRTPESLSDTRKPLHWDDVQVGSCQNYGPFLGTLNIKCRILIRTQKGTIILTATHFESVPRREVAGLTGLPKGSEDSKQVAFFPNGTEEEAQTIYSVAYCTWNLGLCNDSYSPVSPVPLLVFH